MNIVVVLAIAFVVSGAALVCIAALVQGARSERQWHDVHPGWRDE